MKRCSFPEIFVLSLQFTFYLEMNQLNGWNSPSRSGSSSSSRCGPLGSSFNVSSWSGSSTARDLSRLSCSSPSSSVRCRPLRVALPQLPAGAGLNPAVLPPPAGADSRAARPPPPAAEVPSAAHPLLPTVSTFRCGWQWRGRPGLEQCRHLLHSS